jgi:hypothetical protein
LRMSWPTAPVAPTMAIDSNTDGILLVGNENDGDERVAKSASRATRLTADAF